MADIGDSEELCESPPLSPDNDSAPEQLFLARSKAAAGSSTSVRTIQFEGSVGGHPVLILLDSGSSVSFISNAVAAKLSGVQLHQVTSTVKVAGGGVLTSAGILCQLPWMIGQCGFRSDFRILDLQSFDVIVGMDWLSSFSPMHIHWEQKWLALPYNGQFVILEGMNSQRPASLYLQVCQLSDDDTVGDAPAQLPPEIDALVNTFKHLLSLQRHCLLLGLVITLYPLFLELTPYSFGCIAILLV